MKDSVDKLFRDKLQTLESTPTSDAWNQIQDSIKTNTPVFHWYYVAASITAMVVVTVAILMSNKKETLPLMASTTPITVMDVTGILEKPDNIKSMLSISTPATPDNTSVENVVNELYAVNYASSESEIKIDPKPAFKSMLISDPEITIVASGAFVEIQPVYFQLDFYPLYVDGVTADASRIKRAFQYAKRVKNGDENLFNLRKAKENLFAFAKTKLRSEDNPQLNFD